MSDYTMEMDLIAAPITSLTFHGDHLLSGEGPFLKVYQLPQGKLLCENHILHSAVIHGMCKGLDSHFVIYGQKAICVVSVKIINDDVHISEESAVCELEDWIWDVCWLEGNSTLGDHPSSQLAIVLAHNSVVRWDWKEKQVLQQVHCADNCILYSALLISDSWDNLIVASGTVFNQVALWKPSTELDSKERCIVQKRLTGHQGVIFNISYHANRRQLCSVSDDRSIRLWSMDSTDSDDAILVLYGHAARVWDCQLLDDIIVSIGEDATCKVWNFSGELLHTFTGHKGCSIWSLAVERNKKILATGGGDSSIRLWRLDQKQQNVISSTDLVALDHTVAGKLNVKKTGGDSTSVLDNSDLTPRHVTVTNQGEVLILTQCGALLGYQPSNQTWRCLMYDPAYQSYGILSVSPCSKMAALGNINGNVKVLQLDATESGVVEKHVYPSKVLNVLWATSQDLFTSGPEGHLDWLKVSVESGGDTINLMTKTKLILPAARQHWATAVTVLPDEESIVCGDRRGSLHIYSNAMTATNSPEDNSQDHLHHPSHSLFGIHGKTGVTSICLHDGMIYSTGRDGTYRQYMLKRNEEGVMELQMLNTFKVNKGFQWLERIVFPSEEEMQILGFHTNQFVVWSVTRSERLIEVECGGGHRTWGYTVSDTGSDRMATFACVKAQQLFIHQVPWQLGSRQSIIKPALHGNQVTCVKHLASFSSTTEQGTEYSVCATGSEDTTINIVLLHLNPQQPSHLKVLQRLQAHISRVCALASCPSSAVSSKENDSHQSVLLFSVGGRCALQCWRVNMKQQNSSTTEVCCQVEHIAFYGTVDGVERRRLLKKSADLVDPETRYMDVTVWRDGVSESSVHIAVAGSDACVRLFALDETKRKLMLQSVTPCHDACVLSVAHLSQESTTSRPSLILTAATNGRILVWDSRNKSEGGGITNSTLGLNEATSSPHQTSQSVSNTLSKPLLELKHHQSGVNCLNSIQLHSDIYLVASGGDDNSLSISILQLSHNTSGDVHVTCLNTHQVPSAHAAQVSGLHFVSPSCLVSSSIDQRVNWWTVETSADYQSVSKVQLRGSRFSHIADVACMDLWISRSGIPHFVISGQGIQILHLQEERDQS